MTWCDHNYWCDCPEAQTQPYEPTVAIEAVIACDPDSETTGKYTRRKLATTYARCLKKK